MLAMLFPASVACAVNVNVPVCVVVPDKAPVLLRTNPCGNDPEATFHWYGVLPPAADNGKEYDDPDCAPGTADVVMVNADVAGATETVALDFLVASATLVAVTVTLVLLLTLGAVNIPAVETVPDEADQVTAVLLVP